MRRGRRCSWLGSAAGPTFPGRSPTRRALRTTLPSRTRSRARAPGPPPWRPCCPERSSSRVRSRSLATTLPRRSGGERGEALGGRWAGACFQPGRCCKRPEAGRVQPRHLGSLHHQGAGGASGPAGVAGAGRAWESRMEGPLEALGASGPEPAVAAAAGTVTAHVAAVPQGGLVRGASSPERGGRGTAGTPARALSEPRRMQRAAGQLVTLSETASPPKNRQ